MHQLPLVLSQSLTDEIWALGRLRMPAEACGLLTPEGWVLELPNRSHTPHNAFSFFPDDMLQALALRGWCGGDDEWRDITIWHTHPAGMIGPSREDMRGRVPEMHHLVLSLTDDGPVPTWY